MQMTKPVVEGPLGSPPFEKLSISKGVANFVMFKYSQQTPKVWLKLMFSFEIQQIFVTCVGISENGWFGQNVYSLFKSLEIGNPYSMETTLSTSWSFSLPYELY